MSARATAIVGILLLLAPHSGLCSIAVGLRAERGILVQEYQADGELRYCIHNALVESVKLTLREVWYDEHEQEVGGMTVRTSPGRRVTGDTLATLVLAPEEFAEIPAVETLEGRLVEYVANGDPIGVVANHDSPQLDSNRPIVMPTSLNGPGWHREGMWTEQDALWVSSGEEFTVDLVLEKNAGEITIDRSPGPWARAEGFLAPHDVVCGTLVIAKQPEKFIIAASAPVVKPGVHCASLRFRAPEVESPSLFRFGGFRWIKYGSHGWPVSRAVLVRPGKSDRLPLD